MKCNRDKQTASLYLSDMLNKAERAEFERHLRTCEECRAEVERYRRMIGLLRDLPRAKAPESLHPAVMQGMKSAEEKTAPARLGKIFRVPAFRAVAAALVLAVGAGLAFYALYPTRDMGLQVTEEKIYDRTETDRPPAEEARVAGDARYEASLARPSLRTAGGALPAAGDALEPTQPAAPEQMPVHPRICRATSSPPRSCPI